jgi:hypothetical protein
MLIFYRMAGFLLLFGSGCSAVSLMAKIPHLMIPVLIVYLLLIASLGGYGVIIYYSRSAENREWIINLGLLVSIILFCLIGGVVQWG